MTHTSQILDGTDITVFIGELALPSRPEGSIVSDTLVLDNEPPLLVMPASTTATMTLGKNNEPFRLFNDDGWEQCKIISQNFQITLTSYSVKSDSPTPNQEAAFTILDAAIIADEEEIYIKFRKKMGQYTSGGSIYAAYHTYAGTCKVTDCSENQPADGMIELNLTMTGCGQLYVGKEVVVVSFAPPAPLFVDSSESFVLNSLSELLV